MEVTNVPNDQQASGSGPGGGQGPGGGGGSGGGQGPGDGVGSGGGPGQGPGDKFFYFVDDARFEWPVSSITGAEIRARIPSLPANYQLFLEKHGAGPDELIGDQNSI